MANQSGVHGNAFFSVFRRKHSLGKICAKYTPGENAQQVALAREAHEKICLSALRRVSAYAYT